jgi:hypothetical protein
MSDPQLRETRMPFRHRELEFVPLIIIDPKGESYIESSRIVDHFDINATIFSVSGAGGGYPSEGVNLMSPGMINARVRVPEGWLDRHSVFQRLAGSR